MATVKTTPKPAVYRAFVEWIATPEPLRDPKTQGAFAEKHKVRDATLSEWKRDREFWKEVDRSVQDWNSEKLPNVLQSLYRNILKNGDAAEVKLWLQWTREWKEKSEVENPSLNAEVDKLRESLVGMKNAIIAARRKKP